MSEYFEAVLKQMQKLDEVGKRPKRILMSEHIYAMLSMQSAVPIMNGGTLFGSTIVVDPYMPVSFLKVEALEDYDNLAYVEWWEKYGKKISGTSI